MPDLTPYSPNVKAILKRWDETGLVPMEITPEQIVQEIIVRHNALTGKGNVSYTRLDGIQALGVLARAMHSVWVDTFKSDPPPRMNSGNAKVCIQLESEKLKLSVSFGMSDESGKEVRVDPVVACGMMAAGLFAVTARVIGPDFDPLEALLQGLEFKLRKVGEQDGNR